MLNKQLQFVYKVFFIRRQPTNVQSLAKDYITFCVVCIIKLIMEITDHLEITDHPGTLCNFL